MEPITITAALLAGAQIIATEGLKDVVKDAYESLKQRITGKAAGAPALSAAITLAESDPADPGAVQSLDRQLSRAGLAEDPDLLRMAQNLIRLLEEEGLRPAQTYHATNIGSGAIAQGPGSTAAGQGAVIVHGVVKGDIQTR